MFRPMSLTSALLFPQALTAPVAVLEGVALRLSHSKRLEAGEALTHLIREPHLLCHAAFVIERLGFAAEAPRAVIRQALEQKHLDVAELFAFTCPARFATPTPKGLARSLHLDPSGEETELLRAIAQELLARLASPAYPLIRETAEIATFLARANWPWARAVMGELTKANPRLDIGTFVTGLNVWDRIDEWEDDGGRPPGSHHGVTADEAKDFLDKLLGDDAEPRLEQKDYAATTTHAFQPRDDEAANHILLAEAGTGLGKTLGYLAPSWLWARKNAAPVWVSTYTKNLQRQIDQETQRIIADPAERRDRIVIRKGRENYVCLLNLQEAFARMGSANTRSALLAGLIARWARASRDGDMVGGDFPSWLLPLFNDVAFDGETRAISPASLGLTDRRGECIYSACPHYRKCFIERAMVQGRKADLVIANHALVLRKAAVDQALGFTTTKEESSAPQDLRRIVFDEGHHLFDAADSAFSGHLTALETAELRRWLRGPESAGRRGRGLRDRVGDLVADDELAEKHMNAVLNAAYALPGPGWTRRIQAGTPEGAAEVFLSLVRQQVLARAEQNSGQTLETDCAPLVEGLSAAAGELAAALIDLKKPMANLAAALAKKLDDEAAELSTHDRGRIEAVSRSLRRRGELMVGSWIDMIERLLDKPNPLFVEWFSVDQIFGREADVGLHSHWIDPTEPLALTVLKEADGVVITSATLKDRPPEAPEDWTNAEMRTGAVHLPYPVRRASYDSPFDYRKASRIIVVNDVNREDMDQLAAAYRELFAASGGGGLGLFTAISRLRAVYKKLVRPMAQKGLALYAQHVDPMDTGTLVDMFRAERDACLLGTDAVRDGVDVPGDSLRLIVLDRVPWGTPTILERARRQAFGGQAYTDMTVRLRLRQAFGRLIRRDGDRGCFVVLDPRLASRFCTAFPPGMRIERVGLVDAIDMVRDFTQGSPA
jgi:ATP-dependent DNA helicase DinG